MPGARRRPRRTTAACAPVASQRDVTAAPPRAARFPDLTPPPASVGHLARPRLGGLRPPGARCWEGVRGAPCAQEGPNGWRRRGVGGSLSFTRRKRGPRPGSRTPRVPGPQGGPARGGPSAHVSEKRRSPAAAGAHEAAAPPHAPGTLCSSRPSSPVDATVDSGWPGPLRAIPTPGFPPRPQRLRSSSSHARPRGGHMGLLTAGHPSSNTY